MVTSDLSYLCKLPMAQLYYFNLDKREEPAYFSLCPEINTSCYDPSVFCYCRNSTTLNIGGSTVDLAVCSVKCSGPNTIDCTNFGNSANSTPTGSLPTGSVNNDGSDHFSATSIGTSGPRLTPTTTPNSGGSASLPTGNSSSKGVSSTDFSNSTNGSTSSDTVPTTAVATASSSSSINTPVVLGIIVGCVIFAALVSWLVRGYYIRKHGNQDKNFGNNESNPDALSPTNPPGDSSVAPSSFFQTARCTRSLSSGSSTSRGQRDTPGVNALREYSGENVQYGTRRYEGVAVQYGTSTAFGNADIQNGGSYNSEDMQQPPRRNEWSAPQGHRPNIPPPYAGQMYNAPNLSGLNDSRPLFAQQMVPQHRKPLGYSDLSPKTTRSIAPSVASFATTVEVPAHRRPAGRLQSRGQLPARGIPPREMRLSESSGYDSESSFASDASSDWQGTRFQL